MQLCSYLPDPNTDVWGRTALDFTADFIKVNPKNRHGHDICVLLHKFGGLAQCQHLRIKEGTKGAKGAGRGGGAVEEPTEENPWEGLA